MIGISVFRTGIGLSRPRFRSSRTRLVARNSGPADGQFVGWFLFPAREKKTRIISRWYGTSTVELCACGCSFPTEQVRRLKPGVQDLSSKKRVSSLSPSLCV